MSNWKVKDLKQWNNRIEQLVKEYGLNCYDQDFEVCNYNDMIGYQSYHGMPTMYPHWSFGKAFEKQQILYKHKMTGLAYEIVINSDPCLAYLMDDNPLSMQILVMSHVYGHNDFFKNNIHFSKTNAPLALEMFKRHANRIRSYIEDPTIGVKQVEEILDAAHALKLQCDRSFIGDQMKLGRASVKKSKKKKKDQYNEYNLLLFLRDNNPLLTTWQKDILSIVHEEALYFLPQIDTKIMNEGWASFWHYTLVHKLDLDPKYHFDCIRSHNQVIVPHKGGLNPYHVGFHLFKHLAGPEYPHKIDPIIFDIRERDRDISFLRQYLTQERMIELNLFEFNQTKEMVEITATSDTNEFEKVKQTLINQTGTRGIPQITIDHVSKKKNRLILKHLFDGRELDNNHLEKTLEHIKTLWHADVELLTVNENRLIRYTIDEKGSILKSNE